MKKLIELNRAVAKLFRRQIEPDGTRGDVPIRAIDPNGSTVVEVDLKATVSVAGQPVDDDAAMLLRAAVEHLVEFKLRAGGLAALDGAVHPVQFSVGPRQPVYSAQLPLRLIEIEAMDSELDEESRRDLAQRRERRQDAIDGIPVYARSAGEAAS